MFALLRVYINSERHLSEVVTKSPNDSRDYEYLVLDNKLKVLLISDSEADKGAASLSVQVGSFSNPSNVLGLAHFLEHCLFLGTKDYPGEDEYSKYLSENGGFSNAYTSTEETNYYFDVKWDALDGALKRFSQFFTSPLFNASGINREMNAVDSEHSKNLRSDIWRFQRLVGEISNPLFPMNQVRQLLTIN